MQDKEDPCGMTTSQFGLSSRRDLFFGSLRMEPVAAPETQIPFGNDKPGRTSGYSKRETALAFGEGSQLRLGWALRRQANEDEAEE